MIVKTTPMCVGIGGFREIKSFKLLKYTHDINLIHRVDIFQKNNCKEVGINMDMDDLKKQIAEGKELINRIMKSKTAGNDFYEDLDIAIGIKVPMSYEELEAEAIRRVVEA
jgi:hypothetical protein